MVKGKILPGIVVMLLVPALASAAVTVSIYQTDRDSGSVIAGKTFTITASGWSGSCSSAIIDLTECGVCNITESTSKSISGSSVSWDTLIATATGTTQKITVSVSGTCTPDSGYTEFTSKTAPVISDSVSPTSVSVERGSTFTLSLNILNSGGTTAEGSITVSPSDRFSISGCPFTSIPGGQSMGMNCEIAASSSATVGGQNATLKITTTQGNEITKTIGVTVTEATTDDGGPGGGGGGGAAGVSKGKVKNATRRPALVPGIGLRNNTKLQAALEKVLNIARMSERARENLIRLSESITSDVEIVRNFEAKDNRSTLSMDLKYKGKKTVKNFTVYDSVPKGFANSSSLITVDAPGSGWAVVEKDPSYVFVYPELSEGQAVSITYTVDEEVDAGIINESETEIYAAALEEEAGPAEEQICTPEERRCVGNDLEECGEDGSAWVTVETCEHGCDSLSLSCKPAPTAVPAVAVSYIWYVLAAVIVIVVLGAVYFFRMK